MTEPRQMPKALQAERAILSQMMQNSDLIREISLHLEPDDFWRDDHGTLYKLMLEIQGAGKPIDLITLPGDLMRLEPNKARWGGISYLIELSDFAATTANWRHYCDRIRDAAIRRRAIKTLMEATEDLHDPNETPNDQIDGALGSLAKLRQGQARLDEGSLDDALYELQDEAYEREERGTAGNIKTHFRVLDEMIAMFPGDLVVLMAHTSHCKTSLALSIALNNVMSTEPEPVLYFSMEMRRKLLARRLVQQKARIQGYRERMGWLQEEEVRVWNSIVGVLGSRPFYIVDRSGLNIHEIKARAYNIDRMFRSQGWSNGLGMVVIDYLQRLAPTDRRMSRESAVAEMSSESKTMATELDVLCLALAQPNRASKGLQDKRPQIHHLRESGAIEQDADAVLAGYYHAMEVPSAERDQWKNHYDITLLKQRNGPSGRREMLHFEPEYTLFRDLTEDERERRIYPGQKPKEAEYG